MSEHLSSGHLSSGVLNSFADGELSAEQVAGVNEHLAGCSTCTASALAQMMLKSATARAGQRYLMPAELRERLLQRSSVELSRSRAAEVSERRRFALLGWVAAVALLVVSVGGWWVQRRAVARVETAALVTEVCDQHIATLAASLPPQVLSSDRHTVKPWFQGKIPFSFNLPEGLPGDTVLDGANLTYLHNHPVAQLLYSIGRHRVSVFIRERVGSGSGRELAVERAGFHVVGFSTGELEVMAVSDVDSGRLAGLVGLMEKAQGR
jgi:anti-sigma factor RsiW